MKHIKKDFSLKTWVQSPGVDLRGGVKRSNMFFFSESGNVAYQIKVKVV